MKTVWVALGLGVLGTVASPTQSIADTLRMAFASAPRSIDPHRYAGRPTSSLREHVFEALVAADDGAMLATGWEWMTPTSLTVKLREDVSFHDGTEFTARDVVYSACRMMYRVDGRRNLLTNSMGPIADVVAVDDHTVRFEMKAPYPLWIQKMKFLPIVPASGADVPDGPIVYDDQGDCGGITYPTRLAFEKGNAAIGTGPYKFVRFDAVGSADLTQNTAYWGTRPEWDRVQIRTVSKPEDRLAGLLAGDFDVIENPNMEHLPSLVSNTALTYTSVPSWRSIFMILDVSAEGAKGVYAPDGSAPLADPRIRQAMSMAIDREAIVNSLFLGEATAANQFAPNYRAGAPKLPPLPYDREAAVRLLSDAGYPSGFTIDFYVPSDRYANGTRVAQAVVRYLSRIGVKANLKALPWPVFADMRRNRELGVFLYGWGHPQGAAQMISFAFTSRNKALGLGASNYSNYHNQDFDAAMQAWAVETDEERARAYVHDATRIVVEDLPGIPLYYEHTIWAHRSDLRLKQRQDQRTIATSVRRR